MTMRNFLSAHAARGGVRAGAVATTALALGLTGCSAVGSQQWGPERLERRRCLRGCVRRSR